jgi:hypothetical protein
MKLYIPLIILSLMISTIAFAGQTPSPSPGKGHDGYEPGPNACLPSITIIGAGNRTRDMGAKDIANLSVEANQVFAELSNGSTVLIYHGNNEIIDHRLVDGNDLYLLEANGNLILGSPFEEAILIDHQSLVRKDSNKGKFLYEVGDFAAVLKDGTVFAQVERTKIAKGRRGHAVTYLTMLRATDDYELEVLQRYPKEVDFTKVKKADEEWAVYKGPVNHHTNFTGVIEMRNQDVIALVFEDPKRLMFVDSETGEPIADVEVPDLPQNDSAKYMISAAAQVGRRLEVEISVSQQTSGKPTYVHTLTLDRRTNRVRHKLREEK